MKEIEIEILSAGALFSNAAAIVEDAFGQVTLITYAGDGDGGQDDTWHVKALRGAELVAHPEVFVANFKRAPLGLGLLTTLARTTSKVTNATHQIDLHTIQIAWCVVGVLLGSIHRSSTPAVCPALEHRVH
jgi:hypothetical protein